jgi:hypothetical protein
LACNSRQALRSGQPYAARPTSPSPHGRVQLLELSASVYGARRAAGSLRRTTRLLASADRRRTSVLRCLSGRQALHYAPCRQLQAEALRVSVWTEPSPLDKKQRRHCLGARRRLGSIRPVLGIVS